MGISFAGAAGAIGVFAVLLGLMTMGESLPWPVALVIAGLVMLVLATIARWYFGLEAEQPAGAEPSSE